MINQKLGCLLLWYECKNTISICVLHLWYDGNTISCTKTTCNNVLFLFFRMLFAVRAYNLSDMCNKIKFLLFFGVAVFPLPSPFRHFNCCCYFTVLMLILMWRLLLMLTLKTSNYQSLCHWMPFAMLNWQFEWHHTNIKCSNHACGRLMCMW